MDATTSACSVERADEAFVTFDKGTMPLARDGDLAFMPEGRVFFRRIEFQRAPGGEITGFRMHGARVRSIEFQICLGF